MNKFIIRLGCRTVIGMFFLVGPLILSAQTVKMIFPRNQTYEYKMLQALNFNPNASLSNVDLNNTEKTYNQLNTLEKAFGSLALIATEIHFRNLPNTTPESAIRDVSNFRIPEIKKQVIGYLSALIINTIAKNGNDGLSIAIKDWSTQMYKSFKIRVAKSILTEYESWKTDPCNYKALGYTVPPNCALGNKDFTQWYGNQSPPQEILTKSGLKSVVGNNADALASSIAFGIAAITTVGSAIAVSSGLGILTGTTTITLTSLSAAFGGSLGGGGAAAIGAVSWAGVVAAPVAAVILSIVVGTVEGFRVVEAEKVGPMLKMKIGAAITNNINIVNEIANQNGLNMFFIAFQESALKNFQITPSNIDGEVRFYCQAGYVSKFNLSYTLKAQSPFEQDKQVSNETKDLNVGNEQSFAIPFNATNIRVKGMYSAGGWKEIFNQPLSQPTYICYTTYGTIFEPRFKNDCPEVGSMLAKKNELTLTHGGGYSAWVYLSYKQNGKVVIVQDQQGFTLGWRKVYQIPNDATQIYLYIRNATGLVGDPWRRTVEKTWPVPPTECIKFYGTTLNPLSNNECN